MHFFKVVSFAPPKSRPQRLLNGSTHKLEWNWHGWFQGKNTCLEFQGKERVSVWRCDERTHTSTSCCITRDYHERLDFIIEGECDPWLYLWFDKPLYETCFEALDSSRPWSYSESPWQYCDLSSTKLSWNWCLQHSSTDWATSRASAFYISDRGTECLVGTESGSKKFRSSCYDFIESLIGDVIKRSALSGVLKFTGKSNYEWGDIQCAVQRGQDEDCTDNMKLDWCRVRRMG